MSRRAGRAGIRPASRRAIAATAAIALAAGCGGPMQDEELARSIGTLEAIAQEGRLLSQGAAQDRTKKTYTRVHARDLGAEATHEAEKLGDAQADGAVAAVKARAVRRAQAIAAALGELEVAPGDEGDAATVAADLDDLGRRAKRLKEGPVRGTATSSCGRCPSACSGSWSSPRCRDGSPRSTRGPTSSWSASATRRPWA